MQQLFPIASLDNINLGKIKNKQGVEVGEDIVVYLHESKGIGLGDFIRKWFKDNANTIIENSKDIHAINEKLTTMLDTYLNKYQNNKEKGLKKIILTINQVLNFAEKRSTLNDDSSEDSQDAGLVRETVFLQAISWSFDYMHSIKQMKKQFLELVEPSSRDVIKQYIYSIYVNQLFSIGDDGIEIALEYLKQRCNALKQQRERGIIFITESDARTLLINAKKEGDPKERVKVAEAKAAEEKSAREAAEAETMDLRRQLAAALTGQQAAAPQQRILLPAYNASLQDITKKPTSDISKTKSSNRAKRSRSRSPSPC